VCRFSWHTLSLRLVVDDLVARRGVGEVTLAPGPLKDVPAEKLRSMLGLTDVTYVSNNSPLALIDSTLA
jgi:hypothetical protein